MDHSGGPSPVTGSGNARATGPVRVAISSQADVEHARREVRRLAASLGFGKAMVERLVIVVSELATNLARYARQGEIVLSPIIGPRDLGIEVVSRDRGPGIPDLDLALQDGFSTGGGLGIGLPAVRRLMDEFSISSGPEGTCIVARKWAQQR